MTQQNTPLEISEEAINASRDILTYHGVPNEASARIVQFAINSATAKLREENESLQKQIVGLREALSICVGMLDLYNTQFPSTDADMCLLKAERTLSGKDNFSHLYVRREVLEKCLPFVEAVKTHGWNFASASFMREADEALTLARKELE